MELAPDLIDLIQHKLIYTSRNIKAAIRTTNLSLIALLCGKNRLQIIDHIHYAVKIGNLSVCQWFYQYFKIAPMEDFISPAVKNNHYHIIEWVCGLDSFYAVRVASTAAKTANVGMLEWLWQRFPQAFNHYIIEHGVADLSTTQWLFNHCSRNECLAALQYGHVRWMDYPALLDWLATAHPEITIPPYFTDPNYILFHKSTLVLSAVLCHLKLPESILKQLVRYTSMKNILKTQQVSLRFVVEYILNSEYWESDQDNNITFEDVEYYQGYSRQEIIQEANYLNISIH